MRKKTIAILFGLGFGLALVAGVVYLIGIASLVSTISSCDSSYYNSTPCEPGTPVAFIALAGISGLAALAASVMTIIAWVAILIKQAQRQQWAWFVCTLLFGQICMLIWLIVEPEVPAVQYVAVYQPPAGYVPGYPAYPHDGQYPPTSYQPDGPRYQDPYRPQ